jgi:hypothetical protein
LNTEAKNRGGAQEPGVPGKIHRWRRPFSFGAQAAGPDGAEPKKTFRKLAEAGSAAPDKNIHTGNGGKVIAGESGEQTNLAATTQSLLHLACEQGQLTRDDIHELLPKGLSPDDLEALYTRLRNGADRFPPSKAPRNDGVSSERVPGPTSKTPRSASSNTNERAN